MNLLPLLNQFIVPTALSLYAVIFSLLPHTTIHAKAKIAATTTGKKVLSITASPTPTISPSHEESSSFHSQQYDMKERGQVAAGSTESTPQADTEVTPSPIPTNDPKTQTPTSQPTTSHITTATTTLSAGGKTIHLEMKYLSLGGNISGTISGDCNGTITGSYEGPITQHLSGKGSATCPMGFVTIPVDIIYSGTLTSSTNAQIQYTVTALGKTESGTTNLTLSE